MNERFKELIRQLADELCECAGNFMLSNINEEEVKTGYLVDLILSAHLSSCFTLMANIASGHEKIEQKVNEFIDQLVNYIKTIDPISNLEISH